VHNKKQKKEEFILMFGLKKNKFIVILTILLLLAGCQQIYKDFQGSIEKIDHFIEQSKWEQASNELKKMQKVYEKKYQWKDIYADEAEHGDLVKTIGTLEGAIKAKDKKQAKIQLAVFKALIKDIYYQ
jgi:uncharacterized lipoprotein YajG